MKENHYQPGQRVILPDGTIALVIKELPVGELELLVAMPDGKFSKEYRYPEELKPCEEEER